MTNLHARNPIYPRMFAATICRDSDLANSDDNRIRTRVCAPDYSRILGLLEFVAREGSFALPVFSSNTNADRQEIVNVPWSGPNISTSGNGECPDLSPVFFQCIENAADGYG